MIDLTGVEHHPVINEVVELLCNKTQNRDQNFFRVEVAYFIGKMASSQRATIVTRDRGDVPVNIYALALATSGFGKGHSVSIFENDLMRGFRRRFMEDTFPTIADKYIWDEANRRAARNSTDPQEEYERVEKEFRTTGTFLFSFDSGTAPAVKQMRQKLLFANCGAISLQIDEIGSNLISNLEVLTLFLELYDQGMVKQKLIKNTADNQRGEELEGKTPTNLLLFGTPSKLLDGGPTEDQFHSFLDTGYARRCLFGWGKLDKRAYNTMSPEEVFKLLTEPQNDAVIDKWSTLFTSLADPAMHGWKMVVPDDVSIRLLTYKTACEKAAEAMLEHEDVQKSEISHRYFKALKLAGAFAFIDKSTRVEMDHLMSAILLVEQSGEAFKAILSREPAHVRLARYLGDIGEPQTHADLHEALPFYKTGVSARNDMMALAQGYGYKNHIIIKKTYVDTVELFEGEKLKETNIDEMILSYSDHWAYNYAPDEIAAPFSQLHNLVSAEGLHWANHTFKNNHRAEENVIPGFNMIVIDVDEGITLDACHEVMKEYKFLTYTTKRHQTPGHGDRFRLIIPINYHLHLDAAEFKEFMNNVMAWLPFKSDESANQRSKKWETFNGQYHYNLDGEILDALPFIPKTTRNESYKKELQAVKNMDNLERWFAQRIASGNRNNQMLKFAMTLLDSGMSLIDVRKRVYGFNKKLSDPLPESELDNTIMVSVGKRFEEA